ncbi:hypothetical protein ABXT06_05295 [Flavobacterium sp. UW10123]|uniref:hypothetical protein n=1 Tax=Flavobacterium sp. UW10123 TaxID=3230800 RepID=UPI00339B721E
MKEQIIKEFISFIEKLNKPQIRTIKSNIKYGNYSIPENLGWEFPHTIKDFYARIETMNCKWQLSDENNPINYLDKEIDFVFGEMNIVTISFLNEIYHQKSIQDYLDPNKILDTNDKDNLHNYIPFDYLDGELAVCYKAKTDSIDSDHLFLIDFSDTGTITPIAIGIYEYLSLGIENYFFYAWQKAVFLNDFKKRKVIDFYCNQLFRKT